MSTKVNRQFQTSSRGIIAITQAPRAETPFTVSPSLPGSANENRLRAGLITIAFVRLEEVHFEFGSSFMLPFDFDAGPLKRIMAANPDAKLSIFGHADPVGSDEFNKVLSGRRAASVYGMLVRDTNVWSSLYYEHDSNGKDDWGVRPIQVMLQRLNFDPGRNDGTLDEGTRATLRDFQQQQGLAPAPFGPQKRVDHATFCKLARAYMDAICVDRSGSRFGPKNAKPAQFQLKTTDFIGLGKGTDLKADVQGCSEFNPTIRFSASEEAELGREENHADRNRENAPNRRVMILLFRPHTVIDPKQWPCPTFKQGVAACKKRFFSDAARRSANGKERRLFSVTNDTFACRFFQRLHDHSQFQIVTNERLDSRFALTQFEGVAKFLTRNEFHAWMLVLFGADIPEKALDQLRQALLDHSFPNCDIAVVASGIEGHDAAYDRAETVILIDQSLARRAEKDNQTELASALIEEFGHYVDDMLRTELTNIGGDADLDEGAVFGFAIVNLKHDIQGAFDFAQYTHDGVTNTLILHFEQMQQATKLFFSKQEQIDDARTERFEFFGAGPGVHRSGQQPGSSFGHESIESELEKVGFAKDDADPAKSELKQVYFGNWLRDFSQVLDPKIVRPASSPSLTDGFSRDSLTLVLDIIAREHFGNNPTFRVTKERSGVYRPEEHIDNPKGISDGTSVDPDFRKEFNPIEGEIDLKNGLKKYIRTAGLPRGSGPPTSEEFIMQELSAAATEGRTPEGFRRLGAALHTLEDYFSHSNFVELSLIELGHPDVFPWAGTRIKDSLEEVLNGKLPVVTGVFGGSDTVVSVLDVIGEKMQGERPCTAGSRGAGAKIALILLKDKGKSGLANKLDYILNNFEEIQKKIPAIATLSCNLAEALFRWLKALLGANIVRAMDGIAAAQKVYAQDFASSNDPTHSMLAKDHDDHPLHVMAAKLAKIASKDVAKQMNLFWKGTGGAVPIETALGYLIHPAMMHNKWGSTGPPSLDGAQELWRAMKEQSDDPGNGSAIERSEGKKFMEERLEHAKKEQEKILKRAKQLDPKKMEMEKEVDQLWDRLKELVNPSPPNV